MSGDEKQSAVRKARPYPRSYRMSDEDVQLLQQLAAYEGLSQVDVLHLAIRDYARRRLPRKPATTDYQAPE